MQRTQEAGTTFVLVHGSWHGGWCWSKVTPWLRQAGDTAYTPTLTGMAGPAHPPERHVGLDTHVRDVVALCRDEDLHDIVLVGHSYGGMVITGAAEAIGNRVRRLVYLDVFVPDDGESMFSRLVVLAEPGGEAPEVAKVQPRRSRGDVVLRQGGDERGQDVAGVMGRNRRGLWRRRRSGGQGSGHRPNGAVQPITTRIGRTGAPLTSRVRPR